jgi:hypothetical protein
MKDIATQYRKTKIDHFHIQRKGNKKKHKTVQGHSYKIITIENIIKEHPGKDTIKLYLPNEAPGRPQKYI